MPTLRVRFKLNPGREGIALGKLSQQAASIESFLRSLGADVGEKDEPSLWIAKDFKDGSFMGTVEYQHVVEAATAGRFNGALKALKRIKPGARNPQVPSYVSAATVSKYSAIRQGLDADERIGIATFDESSGRQERFGFVDRLQLEFIGGSVETESRYIGSVMGQTYEWNKGAAEPYLTLRDLVTNELIKCVYADEDYSKVAKLFLDKTAIVIIEGLATYNRVSGKTEIVMAHSFELAPQFSDADYVRFFGCAPDLIPADETAEQSIARGRDDAD